MATNTAAQTKADKNKALRKRLLAAAVTVVALAAAINGIPVPQGDGPVSHAVSGVLTQVFNLDAASKVERVAAVVGEVAEMAGDLRESMDKPAPDKNIPAARKPAIAAFKA